MFYESFLGYNSFIPFTRKGMKPSKCYEKSYIFTDSLGRHFFGETIDHKEFKQNSAQKKFYRE